MGNVKINPKSAVMTARGSRIIITTDLFKKEYKDLLERFLPVQVQGQPEESRKAKGKMPNSFVFEPSMIDKKRSNQRRVSLSSV
jgi:hypothetical protein